MARGKSRQDRWNTATNEARALLAQIEDLKSQIVDGPLASLNDLKSEYEDWRDNLPEMAQGSAMADKLDAVCDLELDWDASGEISDLETILDDAENADLPRGFGRD